MNKNKYLRKQVAVILGGSGGIGSCICSKLIEEGFAVVSLGKSYQQDVVVTQNEVKIRCDAHFERDIEAAVKKVMEMYGEIDIFVNAAGVISTNEIENITLEDFISNGVNFLGPFYAIKHILPIMKKNNKGHIINIGSIRADKYAKSKALYSVTKAALKAFSGTLKEECNGYNIKVSLISPGVVNTNLWKKKDWNSLEYITQPEDIAETIVYLLKLSRGAEIDEIVIGKLFNEYRQ